MKKGILAFVIRKAAETLLTILFVTFLSFVLMRLTPVDAATAYVQRNTKIITEEQIAAMREELGLNDPLLVQYGNWMRGAVQGDFGNSLYDGRPVVENLSESVPVTIKIVLVSAVLMGAGVVLLGVISYLCRNNLLSLLINVLCIFGISIPPFCMAIGYIDVFAVKLGIMSVQGNEGIRKYLPAAACLSVLGIALFSQMLSKGIAKQMNEDYAYYLRYRGIREGRILLCHGLPNAITEIMPNFMQTLGLFMAGACVVESVFSLPGLGHEIIHSVVNRDSPMLHAQMLVMAAAFVIFNLLSDIIQLMLDKRKAGTGV